MRRIHHGPGNELDAVQKDEGGQEEQWKAFPTLQVQPRARGSKFEPTGNEKVQQDAGNCRAEHQAGPRAEAFASQFQVQENQSEANNQEKASEIIPFEQMEDAKRLPIAKKMKGDDGKERHFEGTTKARYGIYDVRIGEWFVTHHFTKERPADQQQPHNSERDSRAG